MQGEPVYTTRTTNCRRYLEGALGFGLPVSSLPCHFSLGSLSFLFTSINPFRIAVSVWGQNIQFSSSLSPKRDCGSKVVFLLFFSFFPSSFFFKCLPPRLLGGGRDSLFLLFNIYIFAFIFVLLFLSCLISFCFLFDCSFSFLYLIECACRACRI